MKCVASTTVATERWLCQAGGCATAAFTTKNSHSTSTTVTHLMAFYQVQCR